MVFPNRKVFLFSLLSLALLQGCATSLNGVDIIEHRLLIPYAELGIVPGEIYKLELSFLPSGNRDWIETLNLEEIEVSSPDGRIIVSERISILPQPFNFQLLDNPSYSLNILLKSNPYVMPTQILPVKWASGNLFIYTGINGSSSQISSGTDGENGPGVAFEAAFYDVSGTKLEGTGNYLLIASSLGQIMLVHEGQFPAVLGSLGGNGGSGGEGIPRTISYSQARGGGILGYSGGDGGNGGNGGKVVLRLPEGSSFEKDAFIIKTNGGEPGLGGEGGLVEVRLQGNSALSDVPPGNPSYDHLRGRKGRDGRFGLPGTVGTEILPLDELFLQISDLGFERQRLRVNKTP